MVAWLLLHFAEHIVGEQYVLTGRIVGDCFRAEPGEEVAADCHALRPFQNQTAGWFTVFSQLVALCSQKAVRKIVPRDSDSPAVRSDA